MKQLLTMVLAVFLFAAFPARAEDALSFTKTAYEAMAAIDPSSPTGAESALSRFRGNFDFDGFYARVTPDIAAKMTPEENAKLKTVFDELFFTNFSKNTDSIAQHKLASPVYAVSETSAEYSVVKASGKFKGAGATLAFFVRPVATGAWKMIDLEIDSVLLSRNYRGSFNRVFREKGFAGLVGRLEAKLKELSPR
jgi:ABC-type transporter MlaC component